MCAFFAVLPNNSDDLVHLFVRHTDEEGVLPDIKNPPVVASLVTENRALVKLEDTLELSSLETMASISFIHFPSCFK